MILEAIKPLQLVGQVADFKFESKFEPLPVILQYLRRLFHKVIEGLEGKIHGQAPALLAQVGRASTNTGRSQVGGSRCGQRPARLRKTCYHSFDTDSVQEPIKF